jgi:hypothetical protein
MGPDRLFKLYFLFWFNSLKSLLFLPDNGVALQVRRGSLCVRYTDGAETLYFPRIHGFNTIIMAGRGFSLTDEAIRWAARENVAIFLMCRAGECHAIIAEAARMDHRRAALCPCAADSSRPP